MKSFTSLFLAGLFLLCGLKIQAQTLQCHTDASSYSLPAASGCDSCLSLNDYIPLPTDSILYVKLNFHYLMINPTTKGSYKNVTIADAQAIVEKLNEWCFDSLYLPQLRHYPTPPYIRYSKIRFVLNHYGKYYDSLAYFSTGLANWTPLTTYLSDPNAIDIIYKGDAANHSYGEAKGMPGKAVKLCSGANPHDTIYHWWGGVDLLAHELGHCLGLLHTNPDSYNDPCVQDFQVEGPGVWEANGLCDPVLDSTSSNNIMGYHYACCKYLSPRQLARCHQNLRHSFLFYTLTPGSQQVVRTTQANAELNITQHEAWTMNRFMKGNIRVKTDKTLTIKCTVAMTKNARIIVEPGGQLILDGGTITNISGDLWDGIHVMGNPYLPQLTTNPNNPGAVLHQGLLRIRNGGTISQASVGVRNYLNHTGNAGGIIFAQNANFINNLTDVQMSGQYMVSTTLPPSASWFYYCQFKTTGPIGNGLTPPANHVYLLNVSGVKFRACTFQCELSPLPATAKGNGIYSIDAVFSVDQDLSNPCVFHNLNHGILVHNINPLKTPVIHHSRFTNNQYGAYFKNTYYLSLEKDTFTDHSRAGVYLDNCKYYKIRNSEFSVNSVYNAYGHGIAAYKSKTGAHEIYRNRFSNLFLGINCMDDNGNPNDISDGLKMNCNHFHLPAQKTNSFDIALTHSTGLALPLVNRTQGDISPLASATDVVRNIYGANCGTQNMWKVYSGSTVTIHHGANTNSATAVTQPTPSACKSPYLNVVNTNIDLDYGNHCPSSPPSSGGSSSLSVNRMGVMNDHISLLLEQRTIDLLEAREPNDFELQSTVAAKLQLFLTDSLLGHADSVIAILETNPGYMEDSDLQTVFAYLHKGDYTGAQDRISLLAPERADWADLLTELILCLSDTVQGLDSLSAYHTSFFSHYAHSDDQDGKALAQSLLTVTGADAYESPLALPEGYSAPRPMSPSTAVSEIPEEAPRIRVYPNPAQTGIYLDYNAKDKGPVKIELKDLPGRIIYANFISSSLIPRYISLEGLSSGMYLLSLSREEGLIYTTKIIKEN
jgi:hypothetical protein